MHSGENGNDEDLIKLTGESTERVPLLMLLLQLLLLLAKLV